MWLHTPWQDYDHELQFFESGRCQAGSLAAQAENLEGLAKKQHLYVSWVSVLMCGRGVQAHLSAILLRTCTRQLRVCACAPCTGAQVRMCASH